MRPAAGCYERGEKPSGSSAKELVMNINNNKFTSHELLYTNIVFFQTYYRSEMVDTRSAEEEVRNSIKKTKSEDL
jgi:hypothetical protein